MKATSAIKNILGSGDSDDDDEEISYEDIGGPDQGPQEDSDTDTENSTSSSDVDNNEDSVDVSDIDLDKLEGKDIPDIAESHRDVVAPGVITQTEDSTRIRVGQKEITTLMMREWNEDPDPLFLSEALDAQDIVNDVSIHISPYSSEQAEKKIQKEVDDAERVENTESASIRSQSSKIRDARQARYLRDQIMNGAAMYELSMYITIRADDPDQLSRLTNDMISELRVNPAKCDPEIDFMDQLEALQSVQPLGNDVRGMTKDMIGRGASMLYPFTSTSFVEPDGIDLGVHAGNGSPVIVNRWARESGYNSLTFGKIGSGKSFSAGLEVLRVFAGESDTRIVMIDPKSGFRRINNFIGGNEIIVGGNLGLNPMEMVTGMDEEQLDRYNLTKTKALEFFEMYFGMQDGIQSLSDITNGYTTLSDAFDVALERNGVVKGDESTYERQPATIIDLADVLHDMAETPEDFSDIDTQQNRERISDAASQLYNDLKAITDESGEFHGLSKETNEQLMLEDDNNRVNYINMKTREDSEKRGLMMQILLSRVYEMAKQTDDNVVVYIDEAHMMLKDERTASYLEKVVRHSRHENLGINFITQHIEDFFQTETGENIGSLCSMVRILYTESGVSEQKIRDVLDLKPHHVNYIQNAQVGDGDNPSESLLRIGKKGYVPNLVVASELEQDIIG
jgi:hypothetical protein